MRVEIGLRGMEWEKVYLSVPELQRLLDTDSVKHLDYLTPAACFDQPLSSHLVPSSY